MFSKTLSSDFMFNNISIVFGLKSYLINLCSEPTFIAQCHMLEIELLYAPIQKMHLKYFFVYREVPYPGNQSEAKKLHAAYVLDQTKAKDEKCVHLIFIWTNLLTFNSLTKANLN